MITVIIAGGSGTRLWPLSTSHHPKHLLALTGSDSLLQQAYARARQVGDTVYVVTEASHAHHVREQLPELAPENCLIEPGRRGTGNCIVLGLDVIGRRHSHDEPIAFVHSDHNIRDTSGYVRSLRLAAESSGATGRITLVGIEPPQASTAFGYIERSDQEIAGSGAYAVASFKEKPDYQTAQAYLESGKYLWNCGYFVGSVNTFMNEIRAVSPQLTNSYDTLAAVAQPLNDEYNTAYLALDDLVIDYALSELSHNLAVVPATFDWADIGNFKDLHDAVAKDEADNYAWGEGVHALDLENTYIRNEEPGKPVAVIGLDNVVVVNTPDGLLVARKDVALRAGEVAKKLQ